MFAFSSQTTSNDVESLTFYWTELCSFFSLFNRLTVTVIPKRNSVFAVEINGFTSYLYGSRLEQRASERSAKKFKVRGTIDL